MDLRSKLGLLRQAPAPAPVSLPKAPPAAARGFLAPSQTAHGAVRAVERVHGPGYLHGEVEVALARQVTGATLARIALDDSLAALDASKVLFVDTETTGLNGGVGTLPFLVGLAWFEGDSLVVRQLFLGRPGEEQPLLRELSERLSRASLLVTFNGKCFDWPLLRTRLVMNRLAVPTIPPHLDLLHCSRRLFKRRLASTRLQDLEARVLGFHRHGDIDGALIPAVYFDWLRRGTTGLLEQVLEHNVKDLVSMAALIACLARRVEQVEPDDAPEDCLSLAELALRAGDDARAEPLALLAAERARTGRTAFEAWCLAAKLASRRREWPLTAQRLELALQLQDIDLEAREVAHLALARVLEHRLKDRARALRHAQLGARAEPAHENARRLARLSPSPVQQTAQQRLSLR